MPVALGAVGNQIFDAVDPMVKNRQIDAQLAIARAQIKAQKQAQLLNLGKDLFNQLNQNYQQDKQLAAQAERDQLQAQQRQQELQLRADQQRESYLEQQFNQNERAFNGNLAAAQKQGFGLQRDDQEQVDLLNKKMRDFDVAVARGDLTPAQALAEKLKVQQERAAYRPTQQIKTPEQALQDRIMRVAPDGRVLPQNAPDVPGQRIGVVDAKGGFTAFDTKNNAAMDDAAKEFHQTINAIKNPSPQMLDDVAARVSDKYGVRFTNPFPPGAVIKGADPAMTPQQINAAKISYHKDAATLAQHLGVNREGKPQGFMTPQQKEQFDKIMAPRRDIIHQMDPTDPNFAPLPPPEVTRSLNELQGYQRDLRDVIANGKTMSTSDPVMRRLQQFAESSPTDPGLQRLQRDMIAMNTGNLAAARQINSFISQPNVMRTQYSPIQTQTGGGQQQGGFEPPNASFAPQPEAQRDQPQMPPASLMIGGQEATPFQKFVLQNKALDTGGIASNPIGREYLTEARGNIQEALQNFNQDKQAFMQSLPVVRDGQFPQGYDVGVDAASGVVIGKNGVIDNFVTSGGPKRPRGGSGGGGKPGGGPPLPKLSGQGGQKPPSQIGSNRPQDKINNPATGKGKQKGVLDPDNPNPRDGLPSKVLLFVNKDERGQKLRDLVNKMPAEQRERIQVVDADWENPDLAEYFEKHGITKVSALPVLIKGEKKADGTYQQIFRNETYEDILGQMKDARSLRTMALHPDEYEPLDAIDDRHISRQRHLEAFDEAARKDPNGDALRGMVDPYREDFPGMRPAERINRDIYRRAYEDYRNAQESGVSPEELQALREKPIKALPEMELAKEYERSQRIEARNSLERAVAQETARVKEANAKPTPQTISPPTTTSRGYTKSDLINDLRGSNLHESVKPGFLDEFSRWAKGDVRAPKSADSQKQELQDARLQRISDWIDKTLQERELQSPKNPNGPTLADMDLAHALNLIRSRQGETGVPADLVGPLVKAQQVVNQAIKAESSALNKDALADKRVADIQRQNSPEGRAAAERAAADARVSELSRLVALRERIVNRITQAQNEVAALNAQKASGKPLTETQRQDYDAAKEQIKYSEKELARVEAQIKQLSKEVTKDQAKEDSKAGGIQSPTATSQTAPPVSGLPALQPMSRSAFTEKAMQTRVPASNGGTRPPGQQEINDAYENYIRDTQNENDRRAGRPPSFPQQPPRPPSVGPQSGIQPRGTSLGVGPYAERALPNSQTTAGFPGLPQRSQQQLSKNPALQKIERIETQQRDAQRRQQQDRDAAIQQGFITPSVPGAMRVNPSRPPNPSGPMAPLRTGQLGQSQLPQILGELSKLKNQNANLVSGLSYPYLAGFGTGGSVRAVKTRPSNIFAEGTPPIDSPYSFRQYGANPSQQQQFVQPFIFAPPNINTAPAQQFGLNAQPIGAGTGASGINFIGGGSSNSGFAGPASQFYGYDGGGYYAPSNPDFSQSGSGFYEPAYTPFVDDYYGAPSSDYDYYGGGYEGYDYGGAIGGGGYT